LGGVAQKFRKYLEPSRYVRRIGSLTASFSQPIQDYEAEALIELVFQKTVAFNRTTILDLSTSSERLLLAVSLAVKENNRETTGVLDFGGACGVHCTSASLLFPEAKLRWAVVETAAMVRRAKALETESLKFFEDIDSAKAWLGQVDMVNSNSALQYVAKPYYSAKELLKLEPKVVLWERMMLSSRETVQDFQRSMLFDHGPGPVPRNFKNRPVINKVTRVSRADFLALHHDKYRLRCRVEDSKIFSTFLFSHV
jgi:putative methyltransferase (TIGR04325 family)